VGNLADLERIGGLERLKTLCRAFVDREVADPIIGFMFRNVNAELIAWHEFELAARQFGATDVPYTGGNLRTVHQKHKINRGHFRRRLAILRTVLTENGVPDDVIEVWLDHDRKFESAVVIDADCLPDSP
jgi:truncated hemoglobin YjbI